MTAEDFISRLDGVRTRGAGRWSARCPAHSDKSPSLSVSEGECGILLRCWAGCTLQEICQALGIREADLFFESTLPHGHKSTNRPVRVDRRSLAFRYDLGALDLRVRAERIVEVGKKLDVAGLGDDDLGRALGHVAQAWADVERAELFEDVADNLRLKEFWEKEHARHERVA